MSSFAENMDAFYVGDKTDKPVHPGSAVNVLYFTNVCNLACTYCYEDLADRPKQVLSKEDIQKSVDTILEREDPDNQTLIVLFGGEPTLEWDNVEYCMDYAYSRKKNIHFNMTSNGIKYLSSNFINRTKANRHYKLGNLSIDISFDGLGNGERVMHNGMKSTPAMIKVFRNLAKHNFKYRIRYTIQKSNINKLYDDISSIINSFKPERLITSVAWDTLDDFDLIHLNQVKERFRGDWKNGDVTVPICELFCDMCGGCGERKELKTYFTDEGNVTTYDNYFSAPKFHDFKDKEIT
jgi:sulfatase maturation enzyme AslB (radical SAM superfamily)